MISVQWMQCLVHNLYEPFQRLSLFARTVETDQQLDRCKTCHVRTLRTYGLVACEYSDMNKKVHCGSCIARVQLIADAAYQTKLQTSF